MKSQRTIILEISLHKDKVNKRYLDALYILYVNYLSSPIHIGKTRIMINLKNIVLYLSRVKVKVERVNEYKKPE